MKDRYLLVGLLLLFFSWVFPRWLDTINTLNAPSYPKLTIIDSDRMVSELPIDLDSLFHAEFPRGKWAFELMAERESFDPVQIFWNATARAIANTGQTWAVVEYHEEGITAEYATRELMTEMRKGTDTLLVSPSITSER